MILRAIDGSVELVGTRMSIGIPASGDARYILDGGAGGFLNVSWMGSPCAGGQSGRVILVVPDGKGDTDELVITTPRTLEVTADGTVSLTLLEYVQLGSALSAIPEKLGEFEARIAALEAAVGLRLTPVEGEVPTGEGAGTYDPYAPGLGLCGEKE